jgi:polyisoprenoid-binding protein YceI
VITPSGEEVFRVPENTEPHLAEPAGQSDAATAVADRYVIDPMISRFTVKVIATGLLSSFGHSPTIQIRDFKGEIAFNPQAIDHSSLQLVVRADSLSVADNISDKDRREIESQMRDQVLETSKYSEIVFATIKVSVENTTSGLDDVMLAGRLSLHGVIRPQRIPARLSLTGDLLRAFGEFPLRQSDYSIKPVSAVGGGLKVKDEVKFTFDIAARKQS